MQREAVGTMEDSFPQGRSAGGAAPMYVKLGRRSLVRRPDHAGRAAIDTSLGVSAGVRCGGVAVAAAVGPAASVTRWFPPATTTATGPSAVHSVPRVDGC